MHSTPDIPALLQQHRHPVLHYALHLADNALVLGHRNSEWCGHGPVLEQDIALSNIALDLLGQARNFYQYAAILLPNETGNTITEDDLAYLRDAPGFYNCLLAEQPNGHWGTTVLRQFLFSTYQYFLYRRLQHSADAQFAAIAAKALKEVTYHVRWSSEWVIRLGDGTAESHQRMQEAVQTLWPFVHELFTAAGYEQEAAATGMAVLPADIQTESMEKIRSVLQTAALQVPANQTSYPSGGKEGQHSAHLTYLLAEMQQLQRAYPGASW